MSGCRWLFSVSVLSAVLWAFPACGGDDDDDGDNGDGGAQVDAASVDSGGGASAENLGLSCSQTSPCPNDSEVCLVNAAGDGFCSIRCDGENEQDTTCLQGYTGPGVAFCAYILQDETFACGIACDAPDNICPADVCDGTCPGQLDCLPTEQDPTFSLCDIEGGGGGGADAGVDDFGASKVERPSVFRRFIAR